MLAVILFSIAGIAYAEDPIVDPILGCMDSNATNYNPNATQDDGSCIYPPPTPDLVSIHLTITTNNGNLYNQNINVNACDSDNPNSGNLKVTAYCAILQSGLSTDWNYSWAPGIFLNSINDITGFTTQDNEGNDVYHYWSWAINGSDAMVGLNQYDLQINDLISLTFIDPQPEPEIVIPEEHPHTSTGGSGGGTVLSTEKPTFNQKKALDFLSSQQAENGAFGEELYTDWATLAFASSADYQDQKTKLTKYFSENKLSSTLLTDYERYAIALMSLNLNPYNINNENYIQKIISNFDGEQFGDKEKDNDDIFALIVLQNAGFTKDDLQIQKTIDFILSKQKEDGSWDENVDLTGTGMESLAKFKENEKVETALEKAKNYLKEKQNDNGGWENVSSTSWAMQGILSLGEKIQNSTLEYLGENQDSDGGIKNEDIKNKIWQTSYTINATSGKTWNEIMHEFPKQEIKIIPISSDLKNKIANSNQNKFVQKVAKFQKPASQINQATIDQKIAEPVKKKSFFRRILGAIFGF